MTLKLEPSEDKCPLCGGKQNFVIMRSKNLEQCAHECTNELCPNSHKLDEMFLQEMKRETYEPAD